MQIEQSSWSADTGWIPAVPGEHGADAQLVLVFGSRRLLEAGTELARVRAAYPNAYMTGCSTAGEICGDHVLDDTLVVTAFSFERSTARGVSVQLDEASSSSEAGELLARKVPDHDHLKHVIVFSDGLHVNGSELVRGITRALPPHVTVTGGLSADGPRFEATSVVVDGVASSRVIVAVGFYGELRIGYGSLGGWDPFGPYRRVTRSAGNVLYQLDGQSALALYKRYLGEQARGLPGSALLFPLCVRTVDAKLGVVRTILSVNETEDSMTFAGDIPEGASAQLMKANFDRLIDGAVGAAKVSTGALGNTPECALLISCVGRKMVLQQRIEEEIEGVRDVVGAATVLTGFYSYGEISPFTPTARCELHNQTMTITTLSER
ncbi:MAG: FIST signal transduction protein [Kofleriaceae bacterium]